MRSSITTITPLPRACGDAATRMADRRLIGPSGLMPVAGLCAPTTTTGRSNFTVKCKKNAVSSNRDVPWVTTTPARSVRFSNAALMRRASCSHCSGVMLGLGIFENCSVSICAYFRTSGTDPKTSLIVFRMSYPPSVPGSPCSPAIVPPVAITRTRGKSD